MQHIERNSSHSSQTKENKRIPQFKTKRSQFAKGIIIYIEKNPLIFFKMSYLIYQCFIMYKQHTKQEVLLNINRKLVDGTLMNSAKHLV